MYDGDPQKKAEELYTKIKQLIRKEEISHSSPVAELLYNLLQHGLEYGELFDA